MPRRLLLPACCLLLLAVPTAARADAGTPLLWAGMLHLVVLNFFVGLLEASVLARVFHLPKLKTNAAIIAANYFSMVAGLLVIRAAWTPLEHLLPGQAPLYKGAALLCLLGLGSWTASVALEWPFCAWTLRADGQLPNQNSWRTSLRASVIAQSASYALLVPFYLLVSPISLYTQSRIQHSLAFVKPSGAAVYYINPKDGGIWRIRTDGTGKKKVRDAYIRDENARLFLRPNAKSGLSDLGLVQQESTQDNPPKYNTKYTVLLTGVGRGGALPSNVRKGHERVTWGNFGQPVDLRPEGERGWTVFTGYWAGEGLTVFHGKSSEFWSNSRVYTLAFETPFEQWVCRNATVLPGNQVVFQLGQDRTDAQVVILDMEHRNLACLTMGQGPVVVLEPH